MTRLYLTNGRLCETVKNLGSIYLGTVINKISSKLPKNEVVYVLSEGTYIHRRTPSIDSNVHFITTNSFVVEEKIKKAPKDNLNFTFKSDLENSLDLDDGTWEDRPSKKEIIDTKELCINIEEEVTFLVSLNQSENIRRCSTIDDGIKVNILSKQQHIVHLDWVPYKNINVYITTNPISEYIVTYNDSCKVYTGIKYNKAEYEVVLAHGRMSHLEKFFEKELPKMGEKYLKLLEKRNFNNILKLEKDVYENIFKYRKSH